jgi:hypothetical protein
VICFIFASPCDTRASKTGCAGGATGLAGAAFSARLARDREPELEVTVTLSLAGSS